MAFEWCWLSRRLRADKSLPRLFSLKPETVQRLLSGPFQCCYFPIPLLRGPKQVANPFLLFERQERDALLF